MPDLLFELRCEELPPRDLRAAAASLRDALDLALRTAGLPPTSCSVAWTPRRIAVWAFGLPERTADREQRVKGPRASAAFDAGGAVTRAAEGFARKHGLAPQALVCDGDFVWAVVRSEGRPARDVVAEVLPGLPSKVRWRKSMRWGVPETFARPIRGVVALLGGEVVPCTVAGIAAGRTTRGHPFLAPRDVELLGASRDEYVAALRGAMVLADPDERRDAVLQAARKLEHDLDVRPDLLEEVTNLVEWPSALLGRFDERFLELPPRLLVTVMEHHQRFFPVRTDGRVEPRFVAILNRDDSSADVARRGFERVLVPRLHDATFFFAEDRKKPLEARRERLRDVMYHRKLGSVFDKTERLAALAPRIAALAGFSAADAEHAGRAGLLSKCDLVTLLVGEFPELQGHVGSVYARADGESEDVCAALDAQYRHEFAADEQLPPAAVALLLAENLDILCQFGTKVGLPSGSTDPFGVRRAAITLIEVAEIWARDLPLDAALDAAGGNAAVREYLDARLRQRMRDAGFPAEHIAAVTGYRSVGALRERLLDLRALAAHPSWDRLLEVAERCRNITKKVEAASASAAATTSAVRADLLREPAEHELFRVWSDVREALPPAPAPLARADVARAAESLADPLHRFFAEVFVNVDDEAVRANRHALLREIDAAFLRFADLCRIVRPGA